MLKKTFFFIFILFFCQHLFSQTAAGKINTKHWTASWIAKENNLHSYGVYHFRKIIGFQSKPSSFIIHISADPRYRFFVNGKLVCTGPAKGDASHWQFEAIDIAPFLFVGKNILAAVVWNDGENASWSQLSYQTGFLIQGNTENEEIANTNKSWKIFENTAYSPSASIAHITGAGEQIFGARFPWGWEELNFDDSKWLTAIETEKPVLRNEIEEAQKNKIPYDGKIKIQTVKNDSLTNQGRKLIPRSIPLVIEKEQTFKTVRRSEGIEKNENFIKNKGDLIIPAWSKTKILVDQEFMTTAYPLLSLSGGKGAKIILTYAEALVDKDGNKSNRNEIEGKTITGNQDIFLPDGGKNRIFTTHWYRAFRYIELNIENHQEVLTIHNFKNNFTAYPFDEKAVFNSSDPTLKKIWDAGWRTVRLCAYDTYMDCPYYEQLQYIGDTRIQALISLYVSGDDKLMRNAILQFQQSMISEGLTQSRYPSNMKQIITPFSLFWVHMVHDYWMLRQDDEFVKQFFSDIKRVLDWHKQYVNENNMLGKMPFWNFVDWTDQWTWKGYDEISGVPAGALEGNSSILTMQYAWALQKASEIFNYYGSKTEGQTYLQLANILKKNTYEKCWDEKSKFISDTPDKKEFSQHAQALAILTETFPKPGSKEIIQAATNSQTLIQCSFYYRFYLLQALKKAGLGDDYIKNLTPWKNMIDMGLTTFAEKPEPTRSDCHAWSASPNYDFLATVCGISPSSPGFKTVSIEPHLGELNFVEGKIPHPSGEIFVKYVKNKTWQAEIILPKSVKGNFIWKGKAMGLKGGRNYFRL